MSNCGSVNLVFCVVPLSVVTWLDPLVSPASVVIPGCAEVDGAVELNPVDLVVVDFVGVDVTPSPVSVDGSNLGVVTEIILEVKLLFGIPLETTLVTVVVRKPNIVGIGLMIDDVVLIVSLVVSDEIKMFKVVGLSALDVVFVVVVVVVVVLIVVVLSLIHISEPTRPY